MDSEHQLCQTGKRFELKQKDDGSYEIKDEGFLCPNDAVGLFEMEVEGGFTMEFWLCEECKEEQEHHICQ